MRRVVKLVQVSPTPALERVADVPGLTLKLCGRSPAPLASCYWISHLVLLAGGHARQPERLGHEYRDYPLGCTSVKTAPAPFPAPGTLRLLRNSAAELCGGRFAPGDGNRAVPGVVPEHGAATSSAAP